MFFLQAEDDIRDSGVTGVQTCALPIVARMGVEVRLNAPVEEADEGGVRAGDEWLPAHLRVWAAGIDISDLVKRSEERRVGTECRSRGAPYHSNKKRVVYSKCGDVGGG